MAILRGFCGSLPDRKTVLIKICAKYTKTGSQIRIFVQSDEIQKNDYSLLTNYRNSGIIVLNRKAESKGGVQA